MAKGEHLSGFEELALLAVVALGGNAYGVSVQLTLEREARRKLALGAVYGALDRLERKGYVTSSVGDATPQRGGRRKRLFAPTAEGSRLLRQARRTRERLWRIAEAAER